MNPDRILASLIDAHDLIESAIQEIAGAPAKWTYPVGDADCPPEDWYCATWHDLTGKRNNGYKHTGIDLNIDRYPWGDVDRGAPVYAIADGVVTEKGYTANYLASIVILVEHDGAPLYVRYWHLAKDETFNSLAIGDRIVYGQNVGALGDYRMGTGGDHLHFDMALDPFEAGWWHTYHPAVRWIDPVPILKAHLDPARVDAMLAKN